MTVNFSELAVPGVRRLQPYQPGKPIEDLERELGLRDIVKLASNENPLGPGQSALEAMRSCAGSLHRYPDGNGFALKAALAERLGVAPGQITLGNGSNELLELLARAFMTPADEVVFSQHAFAVYPLVTQAVGARAVVTPARDWGHDLEAMQAAVGPKTRLVFIANPNNPTGTWLAAEALRSFVSALPAHVLVVLDEAYFEYVEEPAYPDTMAWLAECPNLVITRTFSKIHGLAGLRVGYGVSHPDVADLLNRVRQPFNVNSVALAAARAALADIEHVERSVNINRRGMQQLVAACGELGLEYIPSVGNFLSIDMACPGAEAYRALLHEGVIVRPLANYEMPQHLRVTIGLEAENARFIAALRKVLGR